MDTHKTIAEKLKEKRAKIQQLKQSLKVNAEFDKKVAKEWEVTELEGWPE